MVSRARKARLAFPPFVVGLVFLGVLGLVAAGFVATTGEERAAGAARAASKAMSGPPCRPIDRRAYEQSREHAPEVTSFEGISFERRAGHVMCANQRYGFGQGWGTFPACQFTGPLLVRVTAPAGEAYFAAPTGQAVRVAVMNAAPRCVLIARFRM